MTIDEMIAVLEAAKRGETIQSRPNGGSRWEDTPLPSWAFASREYRIKPREPRVLYLLALDNGDICNVVYNGRDRAERQAAVTPGSRIVEFREVLP